MKSFARRLAVTGVILGAVAGLAGCTPSQGTALAGGTPKLACAQIIDYSVVLLTADVNNTGGTPIVVTMVSPLRVSNMVVDEVRVGPKNAALSTINQNSTAFYGKQFKPVGEGMTVRVPAHTRYQLVALAHVADHTTVGSITAFAVDYKIGWRTYRGTTTVGYKMSSRANACAVTNS